MKLWLFLLLFSTTTLTASDCLIDNFYHLLPYPMFRQGSLLLPGEPLQADLRDTEVHRYTLLMDDWRLYSISVNQIEVDVMVRLLSPAGKILYEVNLAPGNSGLEMLNIFPTTPGIYSLEIYRKPIKQNGGCYEVQVEEGEEVNVTDFVHADAFLAYMKGDFQKAMELWEQTGRQVWRARALYGQAMRDFRAGRMQQINERLEQVAFLQETIGDKNGLAETLTALGFYYKNTGQLRNAIDSLLQALKVYRYEGNRRGEATVTDLMAEIHYLQGYAEMAMEEFQNAIRLWELAGEEAGKGNSYYKLGVIYHDQGDVQESMECYSRALALLRSVSDLRTEAAVLDAIGILMVDLGEYQKAFDYCMWAVSLARSFEDPFTEASALNHLGRIFQSAGDFLRAKRDHELALELYTRLENGSGKAATYHHLGNIHRETGNLQKATEYYEKALALLRLIGLPRQEASLLNNLGDVYFKLGQIEIADRYYRTALVLAKQIKDSRTEAATLNNLGNLYHQSGDLYRALHLYGQALEERRASGDRVGEASTLYDLARLTARHGSLQQAEEYIRAAIRIVESVHTHLWSYGLRAGFFASTQKYYSFYTDLLFELHRKDPGGGYDVRALQVSERSRARSLLEHLAESNFNVRKAVNPQLLEEERNLLQSLHSKLDAQLRLISGNYTEEAEKLDNEIHSLTRSYEELVGKIRRNSPVSKEVETPEPLDLEAIQQNVLDDQTLLLEYALGEEKSYLWAVTKNSFHSYELPPGREIEKYASEFYQLLSGTHSFGSNYFYYRKLAEKLSNLLLNPVAPLLRRRRLLLVTDGPLLYVPFSALTTPGKSDPLVVYHEITHIPSATTLAALRKQYRNREPAPKMVAVFADPVFEIQDQRLRNSGTYRTRLKQKGGFSRLPFTRREAQAILSLVPPAERLEALDFRASREVFTAPELANYRIIHLATHGYYNSENPELSGIVLSLFDPRGRPQNGFIPAIEVFHAQLNADLVVLSGCKTALGKEVRGEGLLGLTRAFLYAGSSRVIASLWKVDDSTTADFMRNLYEGMFGPEKLTPSQALRLAQIQTWKKNRGEIPTLWAAFILQGEYL